MGSIKCIGCGLVFTPDPVFSHRCPSCGCDYNVFHTGERKNQITYPYGHYVKNFKKNTEEDERTIIPLVVAIGMSLNVPPNDGTLSNSPDPDYTYSPGGGDFGGAGSSDDFASTNDASNSSDSSSSSSDSGSFDSGSSSDSGSFGD